MMHFEAYIFDLYGTLVDINSLVDEMRGAFGADAKEALDAWRAKQISYAFAATLMERYEPFDRITASALDYVAARFDVALDARGRERLIAAWSSLPVYADVRQALRALRERGAELAVLSNGTPAAIDETLERAGIRTAFKHVLSVDSVRAYKPSPAVYALAERAFERPRSEIGFISSNGWDATGAATFGFSTLWCNRAGLPAERFGTPPLRVIAGLDELVREQRPLRLAVTGDPVAHSMSPALHRGLLDADGRAGTYEAIRIGAGEGTAGFAKLRAAGYDGLNVTTPLKEEAYRICNRVDEFALALGAVNTLVFSSHATYGFNTDGAGAVGAVLAARESRSCAGMPVLVLGAGPTARASALALAAAGARLVIWNRTPGRAAELANDAARWAARAGIDGHAISWASREGRDAFEAALSTLPPDADVPDDVRDALLAAGAVIDANYGERATLAMKLGRSVAGGVAMLRASSRASYALWSAGHDVAELDAMTKPRP